MAKIKRNWTIFKTRKREKNLGRIKQIKRVRRIQEILRVIKERIAYQII